MDDPTKKVFRVDKNWGHFYQYATNEKATVKVHTVRKGEVLSLQSHENRDEMWIPLDDGFRILIDGSETLAEPGQVFFIRRGQKHRMESTQKDARLLEICFGDFDEKDIVRYEDKYGREGSNEII